MDLASLTKEMGLISKDDLLNLRIDTTALAQMLGISGDTLSRYVKSGHIELDHGRRMKLGDALRIDIREVKAAARCAKGFTPKRQTRRSHV